MMRERLARAYLETKWGQSSVANIMKAKTARSHWWSEKQKALGIVDAILAELREPSEAMVQAGERFHGDVDAIWRAMTDAIGEKPNG